VGEWGRWGPLHENCFDLGVSVVADSGVGALFLGELAEGGGMFVVLDDVAGGDDILEAVALSYLSAFLSFSSYDEHGVVFLDHLSHGGVAADELRRGDFDIELS